jgi:hypothetical protein
VRFPRATRQHKLFCHITQTWRGQPLISRQTVVELIASTTTKAGLTVRCELDTGTYPKGIQVSKEEMATLNITGDAFHPEWNGRSPSRRGTCCKLLIGNDILNYGVKVGSLHKPLTSASADAGLMW